MATRRPAKRSGHTPTASTAALPRTDLHVYRSPVAGPLLLHIPTSRLFGVSEGVADYLEGRPGAEKAALAELAQIGLAEPTPEPTFPSLPADLSPEEASRRTLESVKWGNLTLFITDRCNLQCDYCFEGYAPLWAAGRTITKETAGQALDFFFDRLFPNAEVYDLHLFGGEPLLAWDMVEWVTAEALKRGKARGKPVYLSISTNAIGLTAKQADFLREHEFDVSVSLDGPAEVHDRFRKTADGRGTHAEVLKGLSHLLDGRPPYTSVAGRLHDGNTDVYRDFLALYESTGGPRESRSRSPVCRPATRSVSGPEAWSGWRTPVASSSSSCWRRPATGRTGTLGRFYSATTMRCGLPSVCCSHLLGGTGAVQVGVRSLSIVGGRCGRANRSLAWLGNGLGPQRAWPGSDIVPGCNPELRGGSARPAGHVTCAAADAKRTRLSPRRSAGIQVPLIAR